MTTAITLATSTRFNMFGNPDYNPLDPLDNETYLFTVALDEVQMLTGTRGADLLDMSPLHQFAVAFRVGELRERQAKGLPISIITFCEGFTIERAAVEWHKRQQAAYEASKSKAVQIAYDAAKARENENEKAFATLAASGRFPRVRFYEEGAKTVRDDTQIVVAVGPAFDATTWINILIKAFGLTSDVAVIRNIADYTDVPSVVRLVNSITGAKIKYALSY